MGGVLYHEILPLTDEGTMSVLEQCSLFLCHNMIWKHFVNVSESGHGCVIFEEVHGTSLPLVPCSLALITVDPKAVRILIIWLIISFRHKCQTFAVFSLSIRMIFYFFLVINDTKWNGLVLPDISSNFKTLLWTLGSFSGCLSLLLYILYPKR